MFEPIAIVGRSCVLPGALNPEELWQLVAVGRDVVSTAPDGYWKIENGALARLKAAPTPEFCHSDRGGYVRGFDNVFDPGAYDLPREKILELDPLFQWLLHCAREALNQAGTNIPNRNRIDFISGNLSYSTQKFGEFARSVWQVGDAAPAQATAPENRFMSGYPAHFVANALGLGGDAFCLDAACASSLYAIKIACDRLQDRSADLVLAGGANHADDLVLHIGFTSLQALSPSGQSRPFHQDADGLLPAEGAAMVALKRLDDAVENGDRIFGVIRGVGLSNDGRQSGFLAPDAGGQIRAMEAAYRSAGIDPATISFVECHATGTAVGDAVEIASMNKVFGGNTDLPVGSLKSNLGHLVTASGAASLIKLLSAMEAQTLPPTLHAEKPIDVLRDGPLRPLAASEPWNSQEPRRAAINNFGFGGNNAHLIVEEWQADNFAVPAQVKAAKTEPEIAICGVGIAADGCRSVADFVQKMTGEESASRKQGFADIEISLRELRFPPHDLKAGLAQHTAFYEVGLQAVRNVNNLPQDRTGVFVGMGCDPEMARFGLRWRMAEISNSSADLIELQDAVVGGLDAAGVLGCMPNLVANRLNAQFDWHGQGYSVSSEELSGVTALQLAVRALRHGELDAALVGAVDLSREPVHEAAAAALFPPSRQTSGDAAVALVLKRLEDAQRDGDTVYAVVDHVGDDIGVAPSAPFSLIDAESVVTRRFGHAHAASGLLHVLAASIGLATASDLTNPKLACRNDAGDGVDVVVRSFSGRERHVVLKPAKNDTKSFSPQRPCLRVFSGADRDDVRQKLKAGVEGGTGLARLAIVAASPDGLASQLQAAATFMAAEPLSTPPAGIFYREQPMSGELALVFTGAAGAYPGMARELLMALPEIGDRLAAKHPVLVDVAEQNFHADAEQLARPQAQLETSSLMCQIHADVSLNILGLKPAAAIGLSSGETNSLFAFDVWRDMTAMFAEIDASGMYGRHLTGDCLTAAAAGGGDGPVQWRNWRLLAPLENVRQAVEAEPHVEMTIINSAADCVIGGAEDACRRVIAEIGKSRAIALGHDMVVHCPTLEPFAEVWRDIHFRKTHAVKDVRFYANAFTGAYTPTKQKIAEALTTQALAPIDFPATIKAAWRDGVRIFLEHGPRNVLSGTISKILGEKEHIVLALDETGRGDIDQLFEVAARLFVAGVALDLDGLKHRFPEHRNTTAADGKTLRLPAHPPLIQLPGLRSGDQAATLKEDLGQTMPLPPGLPPIADIAPVLPLEAEPIPGAVPGLNPVVPSAGDDQTRAQLIARTTEVHRAFLKQQNDLYQEFLGVQARVLRRYTAGEIPDIGFEQRAPAQSAAASDASNITSKFPGLKISRAELETLAVGKISSVLGPMFEQQDDFRRQVRMPTGALLLCDRVLGIEGDAGGMGKGAIWTETDVAEDSWYLHHGSMTPGLTIESGQADLLLVSWLGADFVNQDDRVYRLLGCQVSFHGGGLPKIGDTLRFDIHIDGHAKTGDVRLFFFHYDCYIGDRHLLTVREGQAGFFTDAELASSGGVLWDAASDQPKPSARLDALPNCSAKRHFDEAEVKTFVDGDAYGCFGDGFELAAPHQRTPTIPSGRLQLIDRVPTFDPNGGPWGRGYLKAECDVPVDSWFYDGHFLNDPCMPGTLMADAVSQAMSFYLAATGFTIERDGWTFEPTTDEAFEFVCRGQVIPDAPHVLTYEVFVEEIIAGENPTLYAAVLCSSDGFKVFQCRRFGMRLAVDWPLNSRRSLLDQTAATFFETQDGPLRGDYGALLAAAWGPPSEAFGPKWAKFDGVQKLPRLPGPPYHFMTRIVDLNCPIAEPTTNGKAVVEYDVPPDAWYFRENGTAVMPYGVLMEVLLQPCGWLASYMGFALTDAPVIAFRNLDGGDAVTGLEITPDCGVLRTETTLTRYSKVGDMTLVFFDVACFRGSDPVMSMTTSFGFFDGAALASQVGLPVTPEDRERLRTPSAQTFDLSDKSSSLFGRGPAIADGSLLMLDQVSGFWPEGGEAGLGRIRGRQIIRPDVWYFKAHFYQDPVQPGSLGIEALMQLLQCFVRLKNLHEGESSWRFEAIALDQALVWKYRGQVVPTRKEVTTELEITRIEKSAAGILVCANGSLWVDGLRIYEVENLATRMVPDDVADRAGVVLLDTQDQPWILDHCPTYTVPALPMMSVVDEMASAIDTDGQKIVAFENVQMYRWIDFRQNPVFLQITDGAKTEVRRPIKVSVLSDQSDDRPMLAARGEVVLAQHYPEAPPLLDPLDEDAVGDDLYDTGELFHGASFQVAHDLRRNGDGASFVVNVGGGGLPVGTSIRCCWTACSMASRTTRPNCGSAKKRVGTPRILIGLNAWHFSMTYPDKVRSASKFGRRVGRKKADKLNAISR